MTDKRSELETFIDLFADAYRPRSRACQCDCGYCSEDHIKAGFFRAVSILENHSSPIEVATALYLLKKYTGEEP